MQWNLKDTIARRVVDYYIDNPPVYEQIVHTQAVASYTRLIAVGEEPDAHRVDLLEVAAWLHDIGCPEARRLYGDSRPMHQQETVCRMAGITGKVERVAIRGARKVTEHIEKYKLVTTHTARRTGATLMYLEGVDTLSVMRITGHKTEKEFMKYIRVGEEENAALVAKSKFFG